MNKLETGITIFRDFLTRFPYRFLFLGLLIFVQGIISSMSLLSIVPLSDFLIDSSLKSPTNVTLRVVTIFENLDISISFWSLGLAFVLLNLLRGAMDVFIVFSVLQIKYAIIRSLIGEALSSFLNARWEFFSSARSGELLNSFNKEIFIIGDTVGQMSSIFSNILQVVMLLIVPLWLNAYMTLTTITITGLLAIPFLFLSRLSYNYGRKNTETANISTGIISEILQGARLIIGFGRQKKENERYLKAFDDHTHFTLRSQTMTSAISYLFRPLAMFAAITAMAIELNKSTPIPELAAVLWSLLATMPLFATLIHGRVSINNFLPSYSQLNSLKSKAIEFAEVQGEIIFNKLEKSIEFSKVSFTYPGRVHTLNNINFCIQKNNMTALIGESGSGKSTITDLLLGLQIPDKGEILVDGVALNDLNKNSFRERIGYVPQEAMLFQTSIRENLLWSYNQATENDIWDALRLANAEKFVKELPQGIDTIVGDRGARLSGGQRQRIALARALIKKPELLILDEATSSLDSESEQLIQLSIEQIAYNTTILIVSHRLSTIAKANQVYVLSNGEIIEEGSFSALSSKNKGVLNNMLLKQTP